jgi:CMP-N,N'-diacetyllegionaminic acid synthase
MKKLKVLGFIPARGGSTRLPKKNILGLGGKPLIAYTIEAAISSNCFSKIVLSTDSSEIAQVAKKRPGVTVDKRPAYLATSTATALNTLLEFMKRQKMGKFDVVAMLLPTCPFRTGKDIKEGVSLLNRQVDSVISITKYEFPYEMSLHGRKNGIIKPFINPSPLVTGDTRSQDQKEYFHPNGGFYISWWSSILKYGNFFKGTIVSYYMDKIKSVDIDTKLDLQIARLIHKEYIAPKIKKSK